VREEPLGAAAGSAIGRRPPHLPFRRISMPSVPSQVTMAQLRTANMNAKKDHRVSVASQQSTDSLPEGQRVGEHSSHNSSNNIGFPSPKSRRTMSRPSSLQPPPKTSMVTASAVAKRKKVLRELLDTEKTYLDGLEFINEVRNATSIPALANRL
jgi:FYVE, RhoGEF and PH domain containing 5/6